VNDTFTQLAGQARELHEQLQRASVATWIRQPAAALICLREAAEQLDTMRLAIAGVVQQKADP